MTQLFDEDPFAAEIASPEPVEAEIQPETSPKAKVKATDYMEVKTPARRTRGGRKFTPRSDYADPADDPAPLGDDSVNSDFWIAKITQMVEMGAYEMAEMEGMKYAFACVKAKGVMLDPDDPRRKSMYRYVQVDRFNWQTIVDELGFPPVPGMPSALAIATNSVRRSSEAPLFIVHSREPEQIEQIEQQEGLSPWVEPRKTTVAIVQPPSEEKRQEIEERRAALPPRRKRAWS